MMAKEDSSSIVSVKDATKFYGNQNKIKGKPNFEDKILKDKLIPIVKKNNVVKWSKKKYALRPTYKPKERSRLKGVRLDLNWKKRKTIAVASTCSSISTNEISDNAKLSEFKMEYAHSGDTTNKRLISKSNECFTAITTLSSSKTSFAGPADGISVMSTHTDKLPKKTISTLSSTSPNSRRHVYHHDSIFWTTNLYGNKRCQVGLQSNSSPFKQESQQKLFASSKTSENIPEDSHLIYAHSSSSDSVPFSVTSANSSTPIKSCAKTIPVTASPTSMAQVSSSNTVNISFSTKQSPFCTVSSTTSKTSLSSVSTPIQSPHKNRGKANAENSPTQLEDHNFMLSALDSSFNAVPHINLQDSNLRKKSSKKTCSIFENSPSQSPNFPNRKMSTQMNTILDYFYKTNSPKKRKNRGTTTLKLKEQVDDIDLPKKRKIQSILVAKELESSQDLSDMNEIFASSSQAENERSDANIESSLMKEWQEDSSDNVTSEIRKGTTSVIEKSKEITDLHSVISVESETESAEHFFYDILSEIKADSQFHTNSLAKEKPENETNEVGNQTLQTDGDIFANKASNINESLPIQPLKNASLVNEKLKKKTSTPVKFKSEGTIIRQIKRLTPQGSSRSRNVAKKQSSLESCLPIIKSPPNLPRDGKKVKSSTPIKDFTPPKNSQQKRMVTNSDVGKIEKVRTLENGFVQRKSPLSEENPLFNFPDSPRLGVIKKKLAASMKDKKTTCVQKKEQMYIDIGQKDFGHVTCPTCGMVYTKSQEEDEAQHAKFHQQLIQKLHFRGWGTERVVQQLPDGRIILITNADNRYHLKKLAEVKQVVDTELGFASAQSSYPTTEQQAFLFVATKKIIGCAIALPIKQAYPILRTAGPDNEAGVPSSSWCCSTDPVPAMCGISRIWVFSHNRRQNIASRLVDCIRYNFIYGCVIPKHKIAFSDPTPDGRAFAERYTGRSEILVFR